MFVENGMGVIHESIEIIGVVLFPEACVGKRTVHNTLKRETITVEQE